MIISSEPVVGLEILDTPIRHIRRAVNWSAVFAETVLKLSFGFTDVLQ